MSSHAATVMRVEDDLGVRAVVVQADDVIWIHDDLMAEAAPPGQAPITGGLERDGETLTFGTPGEGMGRLTYRITEHDTRNRWHVAERA